MTAGDLRADDDGTVDTAERDRPGIADLVKSHCAFDGRLYVGGAWREPPTGGELVQHVSPATGEVFATTRTWDDRIVDEVLSGAVGSFEEGEWRTSGVEHRAAALLAVADEIDSLAEAFDIAFTIESGAPLWVSASMRQRATGVFRENARHVVDFAFETRTENVATLREPVGVVLTIVPGNATLALASLKVAPALAAGCSVIIKLPEESVVTAQLFARALAAGGLPRGVVSVLAAGPAPSERLVRSDRVDAVTFTGSTAVGSGIMKACADRIAHVTLELGGKSAAVVAEDADLDAAIPILARAASFHSGQICAALSRILVPRARQDELAERLAAYVSHLSIGNPLDPITQVGPVSSARQLARVEAMVAAARAEGARLVSGGERPSLPDHGFYYRPTIFADVDNASSIAQEEVFGPVVCLIPYDNLDEAIALANESKYGLHGAVFTRDPSTAEAVARAVRTGTFAVNSQGIDFAHPFGGYKQSGLGREGGVVGLEAMLETKVVTYAP